MLRMIRELLPRDFSGGLLTNSVKRYVDHQRLIEKRKLKQVDIVRKKGRSNPSDYKLCDKVLVQDQLSKRWNIHGVITGM